MLACLFRLAILNGRCFLLLWSLIVVLAVLTHRSSLTFRFAVLIDFRR